MKRFWFLLYGVAAYLVFLGAVAYAIGFTGNLFVTKSLDSAQRVSLPVAIFTNLAVLLLFVIQHGIMARPSFRKLWDKYVPAPVERSSYILLVSISLVMLMMLWQPLGGVVWTVTGQAGKGFLLISSVPTETASSFISSPKFFSHGNNRSRTALKRMQCLEGDIAFSS